MDVFRQRFLSNYSIKDYEICVHFQVGKVYCVNENCHSYITHMDVFVRVFSATTRFRIMKFCVHFQVGKVYCVNEN